MKRLWEYDDVADSNILGSGQAWGDMRGKVKTKQIGFVRNDCVPKMANVRPKTKANSAKCPKVGTKAKR